jgi:hypothetical protein
MTGWTAFERMSGGDFGDGRENTCEPAFDHLWLKGIEASRESASASSIYQKSIACGGMRKPYLFIETSSISSQALLQLVVSNTLL